MTTTAIAAPAPAAAPPSAGDQRPGFVDPRTGAPLERRGEAWVEPATGRPVAPIVDGVARFVALGEDYAESFGWQWNHWQDTLSDARNPGHGKRELVLERSQFERYALRGKSVLECGMGGGDDTEILLSLPFAEVHSFDLSRAVDRAKRLVAGSDGRLTLSQASISEIPYPDASFDFVYCHRVLQHTPDPEASLRAICKKVKPGGVLFAHVYKKSIWHLMLYKYKIRWLTKRLPHRWVYAFVDRFGARLHRINARMRNGNLLMRTLAWNFVPFQWMPDTGLEGERLLELEKLVTFDALTPMYDKPMSSRRFRRILCEEGFEIEHLLDPKTSPLCATARRVC